MTQHGWIPPVERTKEQLKLTAEFHERIGNFALLGKTVSDIPDKQIFAELELKHNDGKLLPRVFQKSGSCLKGDALVRMADGTEKPIKDVAVGDVVVSHMCEPRVVKGTAKKHTTEDVLRISVLGWEKDLVLTENHVVPTSVRTPSGGVSRNVQWKKARDVTETDYLFIGYAVTPGCDQTIDVLDHIAAVDIDELDRLYKQGVLCRGREVTSTHRRSHATIENARRNGCVGKGLIVSHSSKMKNAIPRYVAVNESFGRFMGLYLAEGCCDAHRVTFTFNRNETHLVDDIVRITKEVFGLDATIFNSKKRPTVTKVRIYSKPLRDFVKSICPGVATNKRVPGVFFRSKENVQLAMISGWFDGDGYAKKHKKGFRLTGVSASHGLGRDMAAIAASCGLHCTTRFRKARGISKSAVEVGLRASHAVELLPSVKVGLLEDATSVDTSKLAPCGIAVRVRSITNEGRTTEPVYDIEVGVDNSFVADGFVVHNCVGAGGATCYIKTMLADVIFRGDNETPKQIYPWATYGIGRRKGGMNRTGEGSFGAVQAWACDPDNFGYLAWDDPRVPQPSRQGEWWEWTSKQEIQWSHPSAWPVNERELATTAKDFGVHTVTQVKNVTQLVEGFAQGYSATIASMFGTKPRVEGDVLLGRRNDSWAHQMSMPPTLWKHPQHGMIFQVDNQWGAQVHGECPTLSKYGVNGSFWILEKDAKWIIDTGEVYLHSNTGDFPGREGFWTTQGYEYE